ncbi:uncharacterized protein LOC130966085 [Arachis stenosperma]|uniref:uncharacterized protein LOC130966085 n=1 Tax=Arachis stenosperma TaxID=217475 RepID=UPI0025AC7AB1|nr:uncharacterized protein LOC130966085 [Arachis stenosperma]
MAANVRDEVVEPEARGFTASEFQNFSRMMAHFSSLQKRDTSALATTAPLTTQNYHSWSKSVKISLKTKNKLRFIDGSLPKPEENDHTFEAWDRCNSLVLSWLHGSLSPEILHSVLWCDNACELWRDLKHRFYEGDLFRIADLQEDLFTAKQGELSITSYFTRLKSIWEALEEIKPIPNCKCSKECICGLGVIREYRSQTHVICFLRGLNEQYAGVKSQVMLMKPFLDIAVAFFMLLQQERQMSHTTDLEPRAIINNIGTDANANAFDTYQRNNGNYNGANAGSNNRGRGRGRRGRERGRSTPKLCSHCGKSGHLVDTCYHKHGFPPHMQNNKSKSKSNGFTANMIAMNTEDSNNSNHKEENVNFHGLLSEKQQEAIMALIQKH